uniref:Uncharacterized protein n=1 Tax=Tanacetum cinerariifolium TaxID=118510 RepID=A0A699SLR5_TANCI|nr:hypothetical protein [Tanacetum cinerariifolium]
MADGAQWVTDLVGDAGCQPAQCGKLELLGLLGDLRKVIEKHQGVPVAATGQSNETRAQHGADRRRGHAARRHGRVDQPLAQTLDQLG